jgi:YHS domain-containing protein
MHLQDVIYYLVWAGLFFVMMRYGCGAHIMGHGHHHAGSTQGAPAVSDPVTDPVCGMKLQSATAKTSAYQGQVYYFCSLNCREKFEAAPQTYTTAARPEKEGSHGCH